MPHFVILIKICLVHSCKDSMRIMQCHFERSGARRRDISENANTTAAVTA